MRCAPTSATPAELQGQDSYRRICRAPPTHFPRQTAHPIRSSVFDSRRSRESAPTYAPVTAEGLAIRPPWKNGDILRECLRSHAAGPSCSGEHRHAALSLSKNAGHTCPVLVSGPGVEPGLRESETRV